MATTPPAPPPSDTTYDLATLLANALPAFGVHPEVLAGAMHLAGLTTATRAQVQAALDRFQTWRP